mmetsp:Transcript_21791/g.26477  ORF Transcript_21791/g.26477 Transcript_21791/m.26477 type:complete len:113 (-) Transcript_21791:2582-2920(-)
MVEVEDVMSLNVPKLHAGQQNFVSHMEVDADVNFPSARKVPEVRNSAVHMVEANDAKLWGVRKVHLGEHYFAICMVAVVGAILQIVENLPGEKPSFVVRTVAGQDANFLLAN